MFGAHRISPAWPESSGNENASSFSTRSLGKSWGGLDLSTFLSGHAEKFTFSQRISSDPPASQKFGVTDLKNIRITLIGFLHLIENLV